jgi:hypothetical protein
MFTKEGKFTRYGVQVMIKSILGSTLAQRMAVHKCQHCAYQRGIGCYVSVYPLLELPDVQIALVENYPCNTKDELHAHEQFYRCQQS